MEAGVGVSTAVDPEKLSKNPHNPRRYFNEEQLDLLRTSIQEVGILVPLIAYENSVEPGNYVLMDGERRWRCSLDLGLSEVPINVIPEPSPLENVLRMFNIHSVREDWPLISVALSLRQVIGISGETREGRLAEMTGLTRSTVRRAKRLLSLPEPELELIRSEAHLDRVDQVHREDLYLEIEAATSVTLNELPEIRDQYSRDEIIRKFAAKREAGTLTAVTDFRDVGKLVKAADEDLVSRGEVTAAMARLIDDVEATPPRVFNELAAFAYDQRTAARKAELLRESLENLSVQGELSSALREQLEALEATIHRLLEDG
jgi:ParB family transcriptional regulator, chromosome partitioning protein